MSETRRRVMIAIGTLTLALLNPVGLAAAQPQPQPAPTSLIRLEIDQLTPRVITAETQNITVTGKVTNTGDRRIDEVKVQLRRGEPVRNAQELRDAHNQLTDSAASAFVEISKSLERGQSAPVSLTVPVRGTDKSLRIDAPGVYPVLVNVNGRPEFSTPARLPGVSVLLPALSVPGGPTVPAKTDPSGLTVLWPLIDDHPRRLPPASDGKLLLADDDLAHSLAPGGRLYGLVNTVAQAATTDSALLDALCFAVDPDLLQTVQAMAEGYRVRQPNGDVVDGTGASAATVWLDRLRALTTGRCVITVPYADADLVALSRAGVVELEKLAMTSGSIATTVLRPAQPLTGVLWPVGGALDQRTLLDLAGTTATTVLADPAQLRHPQGGAPYQIGDAPAGTAVRAVPIDTLVSSFLDGASSDLATAVGAPATPEQTRPVSVQNGLAALTFQTAFAGNAGGSILVAPPRRWAAPAAELGMFLQTMRQLFAAKLAQPQRLGQITASAPNGTAAGLDYTAEHTSLEIAPAVTADVVRINAGQRDLLGAMQMDDTAKVDPQTLVTPIQYGLLRATSAAWRGKPGAADRAVGAVDGQLAALLGQVTVANPGRPLTLASGNSPIPVLISNALPVQVVVRIHLTDTPGLNPEPIPDVVLPARLSKNVYLPANVTRSGRFTLDVSLSTAGSTANGTPLGSPARLELASTAYGMVTLILTGTAAGALFLLVGLRIVRRIRLARSGAAPATPGAPDPPQA